MSNSITTDLNNPKEIIGLMKSMIGEINWQQKNHALFHIPIKHFETLKNYCTQNESSDIYLYNPNLIKFYGVPVQSMIGLETFIFGNQDLNMESRKSRC